MPQGHLRAVAGLGAPLRVVQQPVLPEVDRVHAGRSSARSRANGAPAATITRCSSTAASSGRSRSRSTRPRRRRAWPARRATPSRTSTARWAMAASPSSIRRCIDLASSRNPVIRALDRFLTYLDPEPHRRTFMKPFMRHDSAEFCATCHKVHLDVPVNDYRWIRGFNDYDNWQASGVSGQGARSFYYPEKPSTCVDCHMPLVPSRDPGRHAMAWCTRIASRRPTPRVPFVNHDAEQLKATHGFPQVRFRDRRHLRGLARRRRDGGHADGPPLGRSARRGACRASPWAKRRSRTRRS